MLACAHASGLLERQTKYFKIFLLGAHIRMIDEAAAAVSERGTDKQPAVGELSKKQRKRLLKLEKMKEKRPQWRY